MKQVCITFWILAFCLLNHTLTAQVYVPDTSLTYEQFLGQCIEFKKVPRDEVWVVNFWASYSAASFENLPQLKTAYLRYTNKPVRFVSISVDKQRRVWEHLVLQYQLPWEQMFLPNISDYNFLKNAFRHNAFPAIFVVNPKGKIRRVQNMEEFYTVMDEQVSRLPDRPYSATNLDELATTTDPADPDDEEGFTDDPQTKDVITDAGDADNWQTHTVKKGDTLYSLYRLYGVSVNAIRSQNELSGNTIQVGQVLKIRPK